ncbi:HD-GYP domain-containing protein [Oryzihumus sp.]
MTSRQGRPAKSGGAPAGLRFYIALVCLVAVGLVVLCWHAFPVPDMGVALVVLCAMGVLSSWGAEREVKQRVGFTFTSIILLTSVAIVGPAGAGIVGLVTPALELRRQGLQGRLFNTGMASIIGSVGGLAYYLAGGTVHISAAAGIGPLLAKVLFPLMVADVAQCLVNAVVLAGVVWLAQGVPLRRFVPGMLSSSGPAYIGYGVIGYLFVILWIPAQVGPFSAVLVLAPLFVARWAFRQYSEEQRAHERTLSALVTAVETKDPFTRGHSERIASLCERIAGAMALGQRRTEALRYAGMLHDIGKLGIPSRLLHQAGPLTDDELAIVAMHAVRGVEMVRDIDFLRESGEGIRHHHERFDGRGYPAGLSGTDIPEFARIIAVADAFDSLTTTRPDRQALLVEDALAELRARSGTHLDPAVVAALERALARQPWQPAEVDPGTLSSHVGTYDHDDPAESDVLAARPDRAAARLTTKRQEVAR